MAEEKKIKKNSYIWSHVGVIIFHILYGSVLVFIAFRYLRSPELRTIRIILLVMGIFLILVSSLSLIPVLKDYKKIIIE